MGYVIYRDLDRRYERTVLVVNEHYGIQGRINPQRQVTEATDSYVSRSSCVESFAYGLQTAGYSVEMVQPVMGGNPIQYDFVPPGRIVLVYHLFGRCFALFQWHRIKLALERFPRPQRMSIFEATARYYFERPEEKDIRLIVP